MDRFETFVQAQPENIEPPQVHSTVSTARQIEAQDVEVDDHGEVKLRKGVAPEQRISIEDEARRQSSLRRFT